MKRRLTLLMSALLCTSALVLPACGSNTGSAGGETAAEEKVDPSAKFVGTWKLAAAEVQGITMAGDIGMFVEDAEDGITLTISDDGKVTFTAGEDTSVGAWELTDDDTITVSDMKREGNDDSSSDIVPSGTAPIDYLDGALSLKVDTEEMSGSMIFTEDGTWAGATMITSDSLTEIADAKDLVGEWKLCGVTMQGVCMYGSSEDLASIVPSTTDVSMTINDDGTASAMGQDVKWAIEDGSAKLDVSGIPVGLKAYDGGIAMDLSGIYGTDLIILYSK